MNHTDEMEGHKRKKMMVLVAEVNRMNEENQNLNSMLNRMISKHQDLEKHIRSLLQEKQQLMGVDPIQIFNPHHKIEDNFNWRIISPRSAEIDSNGDSVSHQSYHSSDCRERVQEMEGKNPKVMDDMQLPSKKRKINYVQLDQIQNRTMDSSMADTLICDESPNMRHIALRKGSREQQMVAPSKRIVSMRTTTEASVISDGCQWRKYGQKMTRNNPRPRSYYKCAMAPSCTVKRQVQRCAEDPTVVVVTYDGEHTHSLSPLAMAVMQAGSSNGKGLDRANSVANNKLMPFPAGIARISTSSSFPTITLDLTDNQSHQGLKVKPSNPGLYTQQHLKAGNSQHLTPLSNSMGHVLDLNQVDHSSIMDSVSSIKADPNFTAALAVAIAGSVLRMGAPIEGMPKHPPVKQNTEGSTMEACM